MDEIKATHNEQVFLEKKVNLAHDIEGQDVALILSEIINLIFGG